MSVEVTKTGDNQACLFDNTGGQAFGPVFANQAEAEDFLEWFNLNSATNEKFMHGNEELMFVGDPRIYRADELLHLYHMFQEIDRPSE